VITGLLREKLGYDGVIMSDSLTMKPMKDAFGIEESAVLTVLAGHDIILQDYQSEPSITLNAVVRAAKGGRIPMEQIDASVRRILALKRWLGLFENPLVDAERAESRVKTAENRALARRVAESAITALERDAIPLRIPQGGTCLALTWGGAPGSSHDAQSDAHVTTGVPGFVKGLAERVPGLNHIALSRESSDADFAEAGRAAAGAHTVIVGLFPRVVCYQEDSVRLARSMVDMIRDIAVGGPQLVVLVFGNPYVLQGLPRAGATLCSYDHNCPESVEAALAALFGEIPAPGRLPVTIPGAYPFGCGC
jgi:beta-N-acetylhexosaminidase